MRRLSRKLVNKDFSIISSNCVGGTIYSDFALEYRSPFVGLYIFPKDFIELCKNLKYYLDLPLTEDKSIKRGYPVGILDGIQLHFQHYQTFDEAEAKWNRRKARIDFDNLYFILVERDGCTPEDIAIFNNLTCEKKLVLTARNYPEIHTTFQLKTFRKSLEVGDCMRFVPNRIGFRHMYLFDFIGWLN